MFSLQNLFGKEDEFFNLLEKSALEGRTSIDALIRFVKSPKETRSIEEFIVSRRAEKRIANEISEAIATTFVTALEREDIEALSWALYRIPKTIEKVAERILLAPHLLEGLDLSRQLAMIQKAVDLLITMIKELRSGVNLEQIQAHNENLQVIEGEADKLLVELLRELFSGRHDPLKAVFLKELFDLLEKVIDRCRDAGNVIHHIVLKNS